MTSYLRVYAFLSQIFESYSAQNKLDTIALNSTAIQAEILQLLLGPGRLYESLRVQGSMSA